jgi:hypothetical protein
VNSYIGLYVFEIALMHLVQIFLMFSIGGGYQHCTVITVRWPGAQYFLYQILSSMTLNKSINLCASVCAYGSGEHLPRANV